MVLLAPSPSPLLSYVTPSPSSAFSGNPKMELREWVLYVVLGIGGMLIFIALSSLALIFVWWRFSSIPTQILRLRPQLDDTKDLDEEEAKMHCKDGDKEEFKVVVVMPGEDHPTFFATQTATPQIQQTTSSSPCNCPC